MVVDISIIDISGHVWAAQADLCSFFSMSPKRTHEHQEIIGDGEKKKLKSLSTTRWTERYGIEASIPHCLHK